MARPAAILLVEFAYETEQENRTHLTQLHERMADLGLTWKGTGRNLGGVVDAVDLGLQARIGEVRKAGLNIMMSMKSEGKPVSFVEDCAVELPDLAEFTAELTEVSTNTIHPALGMHTHQLAAFMKTCAKYEA